MMHFILRWPLRAPHHHHILTSDLERHQLNQLRGLELQMIEEHLLWCQYCMDRTEAVARFIDLVSAGAIRGSFESELVRRDLKNRFGR